MSGLVAADPFLRRMARPPVRQGAFWVVQAMVALIAAVHLYADLHLLVEGGQFPAGVPVVLLVIPVGYASLRWGLAGSAATALWATLLWLPHLVLPADQGHLGGDFVDLAVLDAVALLVGWKIDSERAARFRVETATEARLRAEARYREEAMRYAALVVEAEEEQRRRLARELHDEPLQLFLHLARKLGTLGAAPGMPGGVLQDLEEARQHALDAAGRLRVMARDLRPPALDHLGLVPALSSLLAELEDDSGVTTQLRVSGAPGRLPGEVELGAFRIVQEAARNTLRHASASSLQVTVGFGDRELTLEIADDGCGFAGGSIEEAGARHLGVVGMRERTVLLGGSFELVSSPGRGTVVRATLPLAASPAPVEAATLCAIRNRSSRPDREPRVVNAKAGAG